MPNFSDIAECSRPRDKRSRIEWAEAFVKVPNSARNPSGFDCSATPWLREPIEISEQPGVSGIMLMMPTGAGKTTLIDVLIPHAICEDPGGILLALQSNEDCKEYVEERLLPNLKNIPSVQHIMHAMDRHAIRKDCVAFPHMPMYMGGANLTNFQRKSVRYCIGDEVWNRERWKHGLVREMKARTHDRWNQMVVLVGQGGWTHFLTDSGLIQTEWEAEWQATDRREWHFECPECAAVQPFRFKMLHYETVEKSDGSLDAVAISESARYACATCNHEFADTISNRRALSMSGRYVTTNERNLPGKHGFHCNALTLHYLPWGTLAVELAQAHRARKLGDDVPIMTFRQKRGAENYREEEAAPPSALQVGEYSLVDYCDGQPWEGEHRRFLMVDVQRDHFWCVVRAWRMDGSSRMLYEGKISTLEGVRELQKTLMVGLQQPEEKPYQVGVDCSYDVDDEILEACARYKWLALKGDKAAMFPWHPKGGGLEWRYYSTLRKVRVPSGATAMQVMWSNNGVKKMLERFRDGKREKFEVPGDVSEDYKLSMFSECEKDVMEKKTKRVTRRFVQIGSRPNHKWDCENMGLVMALIYYVLHERVVPTKDAKPDEEAEAVSTAS